MDRQRYSNICLVNCLQNENANSSNSSISLNLISFDGRILNYVQYVKWNERKKSLYRKLIWTSKSFKSMNSAFRCNCSWNKFEKWYSERDKPRLKKDSIKLEMDDNQRSQSRSLHNMTMINNSFDSEFCSKMKKKKAIWLTWFTITKLLFMRINWVLKVLCK